jgi:uncharacterized membrane protein
MSSSFTPVILAHTAAALGAVVVGAFVFLRRKGGSTHRWTGRAWVLLMALTAISSFWIQGNGGFSWIHGLSVTSLMALGQGVTLAIRRNLARHQSVMRGLYFGGLALAGVFTLLPQRLLGHLVWSSVGLV